MAPCVLVHDLGRACPQHWHWWVTCDPVVACPQCCCQWVRVAGLLAHPQPEEAGRPPASSGSFVTFYAWSVCAKVAENQVQFPLWCSMETSVALGPSVGSFSDPLSLALFLNGDVSSCSSHSCKKHNSVFISYPHTTSDSTRVLG